MAPSCPKSTLRLLTSILLFLSITTHVTSTPIAQSPYNEPQALTGPQLFDPLDPHNVPVVSNEPPPDNFFEKLGNFVSQFLQGLVDGFRRGGDVPTTSPVMTTVFVTPTPTVEAVPVSSTSAALTTSRRTVTRSSRLTRSLSIPIPPFSFPPGPSPSVPVKSAAVVLGSEVTTVSTPAAPSVSSPAVSASTTSIFTPAISILPWITGSQHLTDNVTWPSLTVVSGTVELPMLSQTEPVISYWPLPEPGPTPTPDVVTTSSVRIVPTGIVFPNTTAANPFTGTAGGLSASTAPIPLAIGTAIFPPFNWNATITPQPIRPWILTNPLRPTDEPASNSTSEDAPTVTLLNTTTTTRFYTLTVYPTPATATGALFTGASISPPNLPPPETPLYPNTTSSFPTAPSFPTASAAIPALPTLLLPLNITLPPVDAAADASTSALARLHEICTSPQVKTLTLPLLDHFFGPHAYPRLRPFPGCTPSTPSQALRAPGLLNCTQLGAEVQRCQQNGRRVLLSVKLDAPAAVGGDRNYGRPATGVVPVPDAVEVGTVVPSGTDVPAPFPLPVNSSAAPAPLWPATNWTALRENTGTPNLFDATHHATSFALTLFSLFGEGTTEQADLRPLGPLAANGSEGEGASLGDWVARPLGEEVVLDGFDVRVPSGWRGTFQGGEVQRFVRRLRELNAEAWVQGGGVRGGAGDVGAAGKGVVVMGWT